ncbi:MAG: large-conductance mechanosensitive channel protein MscL [Ignavibacteria bacterium]
MSILKEFREFAVKGNMIDLAIGIIIGTAFGKIVSSLVQDVIMPPIGLLLGNVDFTDLAVILKPAAENTPAVTLKYGVFVTTVIDFIIIGFVVFMIIKVINMMKRKEEEKPASPPAPSKEEVLLTEIRDILKSK